MPHKKKNIFTKFNSSLSDEQKNHIYFPTININIHKCIINKIVFRIFYSNLKKKEKKIPEIPTDVPSFYLSMFDKEDNNFIGY